MNERELKKIETIAGQEFNYEGDNHYGREDHSYVGEGEYDFGGTSVSFIGEHAKGRVFSMTAENTSDETRVIAFCPAYYDSLARLASEGHGDVDAILGDGEIYRQGEDADKKVVANSLNAGKTIYGFLEFIKRNPLRVTAMTIQTTNPGQLDEIIKIENVGPFYDLGNKQIILSTYRPASQLATDKIDCNLLADDNVLDFNDQNLIKFPLRSGAKVTINLFIGAIKNDARQLNSKAKTAHNNIKRAQSGLYRK